MINKFEFASLLDVLSGWTKRVTTCKDVCTETESQCILRRGPKPLLTHDPSRLRFRNMYQRSINFVDKNFLFEKQQFAKRHGTP